MLKPIQSTKEVLAFKVLNRNFDKTWVEWALNMIEAGFEAEYLLILAGESEPFNHFEMTDLTNQVFRELKLDWTNKSEILDNYVCYLIDQGLKSEKNSVDILRELKNLCVELDMDMRLYDFYLLFFAKSGLCDSAHQWYWEGADRQTIDKIILDTFHKWKLNCEPKD